GAFGNGLPALTLEAFDGRGDELRMTLVDDPIELAATPPYVDLEFGLKLPEHATKRVDRQLADSTALDTRNRLLTHAGAPSQVELAPFAPAAQGSHDAPDADRMHPITMRSCGSLSVACE